jgi:ArsR family transcriptional regulator
MRIFKALCDETRLSVLSLLQEGEKCACELLEKVSVSQSTLSHHMKVLIDSGIVVGRKEGKWMHYSISAGGRTAVVKLLTELTTTVVDDMDAYNEGCC